MLAALFAVVARAAGPIHGPLCLWYTDPTSTMTIQWIEKVDAEVTPDAWLEGVAGFGYDDGDDQTNLAMRDKFQRLYIRKEFDGKEVPREGTADALGVWNAESIVDKKKVAMQLTIEKEGDKLKGKVTSLLLVTQGGTKELKDVKVEGKDFSFGFDIDYEKKPYRVNAKLKEGDPGKMEGEYSVVGEDKIKDKITMTRTSGGEKKEGKGDAGIKTDDFTMLLKIRYDDGFIAYLNGEEIARKNVAKGNGKEASGIEGHDADKEEVIEIDKKHNKHLKIAKNVLAIEGHNQRLDSSDFSLDPKLFLKVADKEHAQIDAKQSWQFYLGEPSEDWRVKLTEAKKKPLLPSNLTPFEVIYGKRGQSLTGSSRAVPSPFVATGNVIHRAQLSGLEANTEYAFSIRDIANGERLGDKRWYFRTAPKNLAEPLKFVTGGDMFHKRELMDAMNRVAAKQNPLFALLGGDLAYSNDKEPHKWYEWFDSWEDYCVKADDTLIPMIAAIGNHECDVNIDGVKEEERKDFKPEEHAREFFSLFPVPGGKPYFVVDFANYLSLVCLDSEHLYTAKSQESWLRETLAKRRNVPNLFVCYHRPIYGTQVKDDKAECKEPWVPLFEEYGVDVVFENDHHCFKRTLPLLKDKVDAKGIAYLGDGAWGVDVRQIPWDKVKPLNYVVRAEPLNHLYRVILADDRQQFDAFDKDGKPFDNYVRWR